MKSLLFIAVASVMAGAIPSYASSNHFIQRIVLHDNSPVLAFTTTDFLDARHKSHVYLRGPKNWKFLIANPRLNIIKDSSCKQFSGRTPEETGRLDLYLDLIPCRDKIKHKVVYKLTNCRAVWTKEVYPVSQSF